MTTANELTAKRAKANIKSLLDKVNKETGKEHANLSEGVETLVLGFGAGETEDYDGTIELEGDFEPGEPEITDYFQDGYNEGYSKGLKDGGGEGSFEEGKKAAYEEIQGLNTELEQTLYGTDTGGNLEANVMQAKSDFQSIKNKIVANGVEVAEGTPTAEYAPKIDEVYEAGRKSQYDEFWDGYQPTKRSDDRINIDYLFAGNGWCDENFNPDIIAPAPNAPKDWIYGAYMVFSGSRITDVSMLPPLCAINYQYTFYKGAYLKHVGEVHFYGSDYDWYGTFQFCSRLETIDYFYNHYASTKFTVTFQYCTSLKNIVVGGVIGQNINLQWSKDLTLESLVSILTHLLNFYSSGEEWSRKIILAVESWDLLKAQGAVATNPVTGEACTWVEYVEACGWLRE